MKKSDTFLIWAKAKQFIQFFKSQQICIYFDKTINQPAVLSRNKSATCYKLALVLRCVQLY